MHQVFLARRVGSKLEHFEFLIDLRQVDVGG